MTRFFFLLFSLFFFGVCNAQSFEDVVFLKNGSIIKGVIESSDSARLSISTCCGSLFVYSSDEVLDVKYGQKILREPTLKRSGYINYTSMGSLIGSGTNQKVAPFSLLSEHNYILYNYVGVGAMLGYEILQEAVMPLGANLKGYLPLKQSVLFCGVTGGYSFSLENPSKDYFDEANGGKMFNAELGIMIPVSSNNSFFMAIGYRYNHLQYKRQDWWTGEVDRDVYFKRISIRMGLSIY